MSTGLPVPAPVQVRSGQVLPQPHSYYTITTGTGTGTGAVPGTVVRLRCVASRRIVAHRLSPARAGCAMDAPPASPAWAALAAVACVDYRCTGALTTDARGAARREKDNNHIMQVMWDKEIMPVSYSALDRSGRAGGNSATPLAAPSTCFSARGFAATTDP